jgi:phenylpropionate dioxygenase-like ring-hydroxylating dioxygenase large terminal subunit
MSTDRQRKQEFRELARRALEHWRNGTSDLAERPMTISVSAYLDTERYRQELARIFLRLPLAFALSVEVPDNGSFLTRTALEKPVLVTRNRAGQARAFLNVCRHRGARLCAEDKGRQSKFACPYHAWVYDTDGRLASRYGASLFGDVDAEQYSLRALPCVEKYGIVWVALSPDAHFDLDAWLGRFADRIASLELASWHLFETRELASPGWKATIDGYLEVYHHDCVHRSTVGQHTIGNLLVHDTYGPHQRLTFGRKNLPELEHQDPEQWNGAAHVRLIHSIFPNVSISGILGEHCMVSQVWPGATPDRTVTRQFLLCSKAPENDAAAKVNESFSQLTLAAVRDEDYAIVQTIQSGLASGANDHFLFGRNEPALQHYHSFIEKIMAGDTGGLGV